MLEFSFFAQERWRLTVLSRPNECCRCPSPRCVARVRCICAAYEPTRTDERLLASARATGPRCSRARGPFRSPKRALDSKKARLGAAVAVV